MTLSSQCDASLVISAADVIHSVALPSLALKADAIPGRIQLNSIASPIPGRHFGQCSELCGAMHGYMPISVLFM
jgi:cytochrome c oxidase subunit 2